MSAPTGKNFRIWGYRGSLIGDMVVALPLLNFSERMWPGSYKHWQIARKCVAAAPLLYNHPLIDRLVISDCDEGMGPRDIEIAKTCHVYFDVMPQHPDGDDWPNLRLMPHEVARMAGLTDEQWLSMSPEERRPTLTRWFTTDRRPRTIAIWPCAGYGRENKRNPSESWYRPLVQDLRAMGYTVIQFGHPKDFSIQDDPQFDARQQPFFDQVKTTTGCDLVISTDSGSGLIFGAYGMPQITLLTNHWPGHVRNFHAFAPDNPQNVNLFHEGGCDGICREDVLAQVRTILS